MKEKDIIEILRKRLKNGVNQKILAKELDISESYLSDILKGRRSIEKLALTKLGFEIDYKKVK